MTDREFIRKLLRSAPYQQWAAEHKLDAGKIAAEMNGIQRPSPSSAYGQAIVGLIRNNPAPTPPVPVPDPVFPTALWVVSDSEDLDKAKAAGLK